MGTRALRRRVLAVVIGGRATCVGWSFVAGVLLVMLLFVPAAGAESLGVPSASSEALIKPTGDPGGVGVPARARGDRWRQRKSAPGISATRSSSEPHWACPDEACEAIVDPSPVSAGGRTDRLGRGARFALPSGPLLEGAGVDGGLDPQDLQSAYKIPTSGGEGETVAVVDAYGFPDAERDLAVYREQYGLPPCTKTNGCFRKVNQEGREGDYPAPSEGWETESALDIEMVSAACPGCHILLVEAMAAEGEDLSDGDNTAARLGATEISNSWGESEEGCRAELPVCEKEAHDFEHPGVLITASGGDGGYDNEGRGGDSPNLPASFPDVVAVGGTALYRAANSRGWTEEAWPGGGSGCSKFPKPEWQSDPACAGRMTVDVAAVGACESPVSTYDITGWDLVCGTSASSPLVAAIEAHSSAFARALPGAEAFYEDPDALFDVTKGSNGVCTPPPNQAYFCHAEVGYDGPTGNGSPDGPLELEGEAAPLATSLAPTAVDGEGATLNGTVLATGSETSYHFEYGPTSSYGTSVPVPDGSLGTGGHSVSQTIGGLESDSVYHYRLVASNSAGTTYGSDEVFTTGTPSVSAISPTAGAEGGETWVTITGSNFVGATNVAFGSHEVASFKIESATSISALAPGGRGSVEVTVTSPAGTSATGPGDSYLYEKPGPVLAWGEGGGALGDGLLESSATPVEVSGGLPEAISVGSGVSQSLAVLPDGRVMGWGENRYGAVGNGTYSVQPYPVGVCAVAVSECPQGPYLEEATAVAAGGLQSLALLRNGTVVAWGGNQYGDIGGESERSPVPQPVCTRLESPCEPANYLKGVVQVAAGATFSLALLSDGTVVAWGSNSYGQLGNTSSAGPEKCGSEGNHPCSRVPVAVPNLSGVSAIAGGWDFALALLKDGGVMAWGSNLAGELGIGSPSKLAQPSAVCAVGDVQKNCKWHLGEATAIAADAYDGFALLGNGTVVSWGIDNFRQLGSGIYRGPYACEAEKEVYPCSPTPLRVQELQNVTAIAGGVGSSSTLAHLKDGELVAWGEGLLGNGGFFGSETPVGVCAPYAEERCPDGPYLAGQVNSMSAGPTAIVALAASAGPLVTAVEPNTGPATGATQVTIRGAGFAKTTTVDFGSAPASEVQVDSPDEITALSPPGSGSVDVTASTPEGVSTPTLNDRFTYISPPGVVTGPALAVERDTATLTATVNPDDAQVGECHFEYGTTPSYGTSVPCSSPPGSGTTPVAVSAPVGELAPSSTYYFRAVATNAQGTSHGSQQTFTTKQLPELGRCLKLTGALNGKYTNKACTKLSVGEHPGRYEWQPATPGANAFTAKGGTALFEASIKVSKGRADYNKIPCSTSTATGELTGPSSAKLALTLTGCHGYFGYCTSAGATAGEIDTGTLQAQLGEIAPGKTPSVGWNLNPGAPTPLASFECGIPVTINGSAIGVTTPVDKMSSSLKIEFTAAAGQQAPSAFERGLENPLTVTIPTEPPILERLGLTDTFTLTAHEAFEIKAIP